MMNERECEWRKSVEAYLKSRDGKYYVSDHNLDDARIVIFEMCPSAQDHRAGASVSTLKTWGGGLDLFDGDIDCEKCGIGTAYISNVPLYGTDKETFKLTGPLEGIRSAPRPESEYLRAQFKDKMQKIISNEKIKLIAYKLEIFKRYYNDLIESAKPELVKKLEERLASGSLKILQFPNYRIDQIRAFEKTYNDFKSAFDEVMNWG